MEHDKRFTVWSHVKMWPNGKTSFRFCWGESYTKPNCTNNAGQWSLKLHNARWSHWPISIYLWWLKTLRPSCCPGSGRRYLASCPWWGLEGVPTHPAFLYSFPQKTSRDVLLKWVLIARVSSQNSWWEMHTFRYSCGFEQKMSWLDFTPSPATRGTSQSVVLPVKASEVPHRTVVFGNLTFPKWPLRFGLTPSSMGLQPRFIPIYEGMISRFLNIWTDFGHQLQRSPKRKKTTYPGSKNNDHLLVQMTSCKSPVHYRLVSSQHPMKSPGDRGKTTDVLCIRRFWYNRVTWVSNWVHAGDSDSLKI